MGMLCCAHPGAAGLRRMPLPWAAATAACRRSRRSLPATVRARRVQRPSLQLRCAPLGMGTQRTLAAQLRERPQTWHRPRPQGDRPQQPAPLAGWTGTATTIDRRRPKGHTASRMPTRRACPPRTEVAARPDRVPPSLEAAAPMPAPHLQASRQVRASRWCVCGGGGSGVGAAETFVALVLASAAVRPSPPCLHAWLRNCPEGCWTATFRAHAVHACSFVPSCRRPAAAGCLLRCRCQGRRSVGGPVGRVPGPLRLQQELAAARGGACAGSGRPGQRRPGVGQPIRRVLTAD